MKRKRERAGCFDFNVLPCLVTVYVLWLFLTVTWVGLQLVIVVFSDHTHFCQCLNMCMPLGFTLHINLCHFCAGQT